ncbi:GNAT family N-acetyltransferase [Salinifilum aidingensis]
MRDADVQVLEERRFREANGLFMRTLHVAAPSDAQWERVRPLHEPGRVLGGFLDGELAGTARSTRAELTVPGGSLAAAAVTGVGVRPDRTRRGVLRALMRRQLDDARRTGEPVAVLHASETGIYERFGYGLATRSRRVQVDARTARTAATAPSGGRVDLVPPEEVAEVLPEAYRRIGGERPGMIERPAAWWTHALGHRSAAAATAVHRDQSGAADGFASYEPVSVDHRFDSGETTLRVLDFQAPDARAAAGLWEFLLGVDLSDVVVAAARPLDEPLEWWLTDHRECRTTRLDDDLWLRLVDVEAALRARSYAAGEPVLLAVDDPFLPENGGCYRIGPDGAWRCAEAPQLRCDVSTLGALYLGEESMTRMVDAGRVTVDDPDAVSTADALFRTARSPWCGTSF